MFSKALDFLQKSLAIRSKAHSQEHPDIAETYYDIGEAYYDQNQYQEALDYFEKAYHIWVKIFGLEHPDIAKCKSGSAAALWALNRQEEAIENIRNSLNINSKFCLWSNLAGNLETLAEWLDKMGMRKEAQERRLEANNIRNEHFLSQ
jgi:tetratricopeptide (TPR) repeat protein